MSTTGQFAHCVRCGMQEWVGDDEPRRAHHCTQRLVIEKLEALGERFVAWVEARGHDPRCETARVLGGPMESVAITSDLFTGRTRIATNVKPWACFCGLEALLAAWRERAVTVVACVVTLLLLVMPADAQSTHLRRVDHALAFGLNLSLRSPAKPYRYNTPLPQPHQLPPSDVVLYPEGAIATRQLYARDRGQPGWLHVGATGRIPLEETHPSDTPPKYGPSYDTPSDAILGGIIAEAWEQGGWRERSRLVLTARGVYFVTDAGAVPLVEPAP